jgi:hypothetical protein
MLRVIKRFYLLDLDRCLLNVDKTFDLFVEVLTKNSSITEKDIRIARLKIETSGDSFDVWSFVKKELFDNKVISKITDEFISIGKSQDLLNIGAYQLIKYLNGQPKTQFGIVTYGSQAWQRLKLEASGLYKYPHLIIEHKYKGKLVKSWLKARRFSIPYELTNGELIATDEIVLIDDKKDAFLELPEMARGYLVISQASGRNMTIKTTLGQVKLVKRLSQIVTEEQNLID